MDNADLQDLSKVPSEREEFDDEEFKVIFPRDNEKFNPTFPLDGAFHTTFQQAPAQDAAST